VILRTPTIHHIARFDLGDRLLIGNMLRAGSSHRQAAFAWWDPQSVKVQPVRSRSATLQSRLLPFCTELRGWTTSDHWTQASRPEWCAHQASI